MNKTYGLYTLLGIIFAVALLATPANAEVPVFNIPPYFLDDEYVYLDTTAVQNAQCEDVGCVGINRTQQNIDITSLVISTIANNLTGYLKNTGDTATGNYTFSGNLTVQGSIIGGAQGIKLDMGSNATAGTCTLTLGSCTITSNKIGPNSLIFTSFQSGINLGILGISSKSSGSATIISTSILGNPVVGWVVINPA